MTSPSDVPIPRRRLCELAAVERGKHGRWVGANLLDRRGSYGRLDLIRAVALQQLWDVLGPTLATSVWRQVKPVLGMPGRALDVIVNPATHSAAVAREP